MARIDLYPDWRVALLGVVSVVLVISLGAWLPFARVVSHSLASELTTHGLTASSSSVRARQVMLAVQVAVTVIVLVDAGLLVQTIRNGYTRSAGFDTAHSLFVSVDVGTPLDLSAVLPSGFSANTPSARRGEIDRLSAALLENRKRAAVRVVEALQVVEGVEVLAVGPAPIGPDRALGIAQPRAVAVDVRCVTFG